MLFSITSLGFSTVCPVPAIPPEILYPVDSLTHFDLLFLVIHHIPRLLSRANSIAFLESELLFFINFVFSSLR